MSATRRHDPAAYAKRGYWARRRAGLCVRCGKPARDGRCACESCEARAALWRAETAAREAAGRPSTRRQWTNRELSALKVAYARGESIEAIAKALSRSPVAIECQVRWHRH